MSDDTKRGREWQAWVLAVAVAVIVLLIVLWPESFGRHSEPLSLSRLARLVPQLSVATVASIFLFSSLSVLFGVLRWNTLLRAQGIDFPLAYLVRSWLTGAFLDAPFNGIIVRELWRWYDTSRLDNAPRMGAVLVVEKCLGLVAFAVLILAGAVVYLAIGVPLAKLRTAVILWLALCILMVSLAVIVYPRLLQVLLCFVPTQRLRGLLGEFAAAVAVYRAKPGALVAGIFWSLCLRACAFAMLVTMMSALRPEGLSWTGQVPGWLSLSSLTILGNLPREPIPLRTGLELWLGPLGEFSGREALGILMVWSQLAVPVLLGGVALIIGTARGVRRTTVPRLAAMAPSTEDRSEAAQQIGLGVLAGAVGGALAGAIAGLAEAVWVDWYILSQPQDLQLYWWAPLVYGAAFVPGGLLAGGMIALAGLLFFRRYGMALLCGGTVGILIGGVGLIVGRYRFARDVLGDQALQATHMLGLIAGASVAAMFAGVLTYALLRAAPGRLRVLAPVAIWILVIAAGFGLSAVRPGLGGEGNLPVADAPTAGAVSESAHPNVIFIAIDTLRADYLHLYNPSARAKTPNLDAFAADAVLFRHSFSQAPWTKPSFATMFTGLYPGAHGAIGKSSVLDERFDTLAEMLRGAGFDTVGFPNNRNIASWAGFAQGFDAWHPLDADRYFGATATTEMLAGYLVMRQLWLMLTYPRINVSHFYQPAERVNPLVVDWLDTVRPGRAQFVFVHYMDPHDPYRSADVPGEAYAYTVMGYQPDPAVWEDLLERSYIGEIEHLDGYLGQFFSALRERNLYDNSIIVLTADHGEELHDHQGWGHGDTLYEEQLHVPLLIKLPRQAGGGSANEGIARHIDLLPTLLHLLGMEIPPALPGTPLIEGDARPRNSGTETSFAEVDFLGSVGQSLRGLHQKVIQMPTTQRPHIESLEFYELALDPGEQMNKANSAPSEAAEWLGALNAMREAIRTAK